MSFLSIHEKTQEVKAWLAGHAYWGIRMNDGRFWTELDTKVDIARAVGQQLQWWDDVVAMGDHMNITQIWLFCPHSKRTPNGATCELDIKEPGTAFQVKGGAFSAMNGSRYITYQMIGRLDNPDTGDSSIFAWDHLEGVCYRYCANIYDNVTTWRGDGPRIGVLKLSVIGLGRFQDQGNAYRQARMLPLV